MSKPSPLPKYSPQAGQDANGITRQFILVEGGSFKHSPGFLIYGGQILRFTTQADAALFCNMANDGFIDFPFLIPTNHKTKHPKNDN